MEPSTVAEQVEPATLSDFDALLERGASTIKILLSDAVAPDEDGRQARVVADATPLTAGETQAVLARLPALDAPKTDTSDFAKRQRSLPPPRAGETVKTAFPPEDERARPAEVDAPDTALEVVRYQPEGEVPIVPHLSVSFNKPMVTIASHADTIAQNVPVKLTPQPPGQWRWVGAKTLLFEPEAGRFPMATKYDVEVPANTTAATKETLGKATKWTFQTPPVQVLTKFPTYGTHGLDQLAFIEFDQEIEPTEVIKYVKISGGGVFAKTANAVLATPDEINADEEVKALVDAAKPGRWIVLRAEKELPYNATVTVELQKGVPSKEGPLVTTGTQSFNFQTYGPLVVTRHECGWRECTPQDGFNLTFSNVLDTAKYNDVMVEVEPAFPTMTISQYGSQLSIHGQKPGRRTYTVTISDELTDEFGQQLTGKRKFTFDVGASRPSISSTIGTFSVLDPAGEPSLSIFTTNFAEVELKAWRVEPADWAQFLRYAHDNAYYGKHEVKPPGELVVDERIAIGGKPDDSVETVLSLAKALGPNKLGNVVVQITPTKASPGSKMPDYIRSIRTWAQATKLGVDAFVDATTLTGWATNLANGAPLANAKVTLHASRQTRPTDAQGIAKFELESITSDEANFIAVTVGDDTAFLPEQMWGSRHRTSWQKQTVQDTLAWFVFDDRKMYRPNETVAVKGWIQSIGQGIGGMVQLAPNVKKVTWELRGAQGNPIANGEAKTTELGGFDFEIKLPDTPTLGVASLVMNADISQPGSAHVHHINIQEFRTPEFEVSTTVQEGPHYATETVTATVSAKYYAGGALPNAETSWTVNASSATFAPPNRSEFTFGTWVPWWTSYSQPTTASAVQPFHTTTDAVGEHHLRIALGEITPPRPMSVRLQATTMDVNRQAWSSNSTFLVHPSRYYVGMKTENYFVEQGAPLEVDLIVTDVEGAAATGRPVKVRASRVDWRYQRGKYEEVERDIQTCDFVSTDAETYRCSFETAVGGRYKIVATTSDDQGRLNFTEITRWVSGGKQPVSRRVDLEKIDLIPDREQYQPGDTAKLLVQSPIVPAELLYTVRRNGMVEQRRLRMEEPTMTLSVPIKNSYFPNFTVQVNAVGEQPRLGPDGEPDPNLPKRPAYAVGSIVLKVPPTERTLSLNVTPAEARVSPAAKTSATVTVTDADGKPVPNAEVALVVVDEAILALSSYQMADPIQVFYPTRQPGVRDHHLRGYISLADPAALTAPADGEGYLEDQVESESAPTAMPAKRKAMAPMAAPLAERATVGNLARGGGAAPQQQAQPIAVRSDFNPRAAFAPAGKTDAAGQVKVDYQMPDNLTRYRIMAVAVEGGTRFGTGESNVTARLPLMMRPSAPRFLNFGDKFELPVVLQNQTDEAMTVHVAARATNVALASNTGWKVQVAANDRVEVRFPASTELAGTARFQVGAAAGTFADAAEFSLPVWTPATSEAFATYGVVDDGAIVQPVAAPTEVWPQFGGLEVTTSSTALQALTDAFLYLYEYDYECAEQISSRVVSVAALRDVLSAFEAPGMPSAEEVAASMSRDIEELATRQNNDGGFGFWRRGQPSWPFVTIHATHALLRAKQKGYDVPDHTLRNAMHYLKNIESHIPSIWSEWLRLHVISYALYIRGLNGDRDPAKAREVIQRGGSLDELSFESIGWLLGVLTGQSGYNTDVEELRRFLNNRVTETAAGAHFVSRVDESAYVILQSSRVADGIILEALIDDQPNSDLIPKLVQDLLAHRKKGRWGNTQENSFVLLALDKYFNTYEKQTPDFVARIWLGEQYAGEHAFRGRTTERHHVDIPMQYVVDQGEEQKLYLQKDGAGRMYYRIGMNYAPKSLYLEPSSHGFTVERAYEPVDDDGDVTRRPDGTWEIKAGAKVRVKLTLVAPARRYHVALVDPLPAGLEAMNPALAVTGDIPQDEAHNTGRSTFGWWWWSRPWFEHQNMRDERVEAFTTLLWPGVHSYTYYARATTPGEFVVPPTKAEEMYTPETFGRAASDRVFVVD